MNKARIVVFFFLLFAAVVVDFKLMLMSMIFDLLFVLLASVAIWPLIKSAFETD